MIEDEDNGEDDENPFNDTQSLIMKNDEENMINLFFHRNHNANHGDTADFGKWVNVLLTCSIKILKNYKLIFSIFII